MENMTNRTYTLVRTSRKTLKGTVEAVEATGLSWEDGNNLRDKLYAIDEQKQPGQSSWVRDHFEMRLEKEAPRA